MLLRAVFRNTEHSKKKPSRYFFCNVTEQNGKAVKPWIWINYQDAPELYRQLHQGDQIEFEATIEFNRNLKDSVKLKDIKNISRIRT